MPAVSRVHVLPAFAVLAMLLAAAASPVLAQIGWIVFTPDDGKFSVLMPGQPGWSVQNGTDNGVAFTQARYLIRTPSLIELATIADYPEGPNRPSPEAVRDAMLHSLNVKLTSNSAQPFVRASNDILPGLAFAAASPAQTCKAEIYVDRFRVFALLLCTKAGVDYGGEIDRALASFTIAPRPLSERR